MIAAHLPPLRLPLRRRWTALTVSGALSAGALFTFVQLDSVGGVAHRSAPRSASLMTEAFRPATAAA
ncbi:MAG TPA: hypothetical protein VH988_00975, partial [Thermoanaerobaculia bacterium]|nr:hypothetical protein [Thermoanaerobaculia bacterium]